MSADELKPCPFCGSEPRLHQRERRNRDGDVTGKYCAVSCENCSGQVVTFIPEYFFEDNPDDQVQERTVKTWNTRHPSPLLGEFILTYVREDLKRALGCKYDVDSRDIIRSTLARLSKLSEHREQFPAHQPARDPLLDEVREILDYYVNRNCTVPHHKILEILSKLPPKEADNA